MSTISKFAGRVVCTKAQFDALTEKDPNKEYLVTDDDTYVVAPSTDGTAGQVLKKTATGTEWADESGGGGGGGRTLYSHNLHMIGANGEIYFTLYTSQEAAYTSVDPIFSILGSTAYQFVFYTGEGGIGIGVVRSILDNHTFGIQLYKSSSTAVTTADIALQTPTTIYDTVTEL